MSGRYMGNTSIPSRADLDALWAFAGNPSFIPSGTGAVPRSMNTKLNELQSLSVTDFGAKGDGVTDDTLAVQRCMADACALVTAGPTAGVVVYFPRGVYHITDTIPITVNRVHVVGEGKYASTLLFNPATPKALFYGSEIAAPGSLFQGSFRKLGLIGAGTQQKIGFDMLDVSEYVFSEIVVQYTWTGNSGSAATPSIGFRISGRELLTFEQIDCYADRPFHFRKGTIAGIDQCAFRDMLFNALVTTEAGILIDANCPITGWVMEGYQSWSGGTYGIWAVGGGTRGQNVNIRNGRYEQPGVEGGWAVRWEAQTDGLLFDGCGFGGNGNISPINGGLKVRNLQRLTLLNCVYSGTSGGSIPAVALDIDTSCDDLILVNTFFNSGAIVNLIGFEEAFSIPSSTATVIPPTSYWFRTAGVTFHAIRLLGNNHDFQSFTMLAGDTLQLSINNTGFLSAIIEISGYAATGPIEEAGMFLVTAGASADAIKLCGTTNCAATNTASALCVLKESPATVALLNNTAQSLICQLAIRWQ